MQSIKGWPSFRRSNISAGRISRSPFFFFVFDPLKNLLSMDSNVFGSVDPEPDLVSLHTEYRNRDVIANHHGFADAPGQD
jgi:hypothetical protein